MEQAEQMFNAYNEQGPNPWKTFDGRDVPRWSDVTEQVRAKWRAAAAIQFATDYAKDAKQRVEAAELPKDSPFGVHILNAEGQAKAIGIARAFQGLLDLVEHVVPEGRERSIVRTKLEEACFYAKKGMARHNAI